MAQPGQNASPDWSAVLAAAPAGGTRLRVKVAAAAAHTRLGAVHGDRLKVQVAAPPEGGKANKALRGALARWLNVSKSDLAITTGQTRPEKTVTIASLSPGIVAHRLSAV